MGNLAYGGGISSCLAPRMVRLFKPVSPARGDQIFNRCPIVNGQGAELRKAGQGERSLTHRFRMVRLVSPVKEDKGSKLRYSFESLAEYPP